MVGNLNRPEAAVVAVEQVTLYGLAKAGGAATRVHLPSRGENEGAAKRNVRPRSLALQGDNVAVAIGGSGFTLSPHMAFDTGRFLVDSPDVFHVSLLLRKALASPASKTPDCGSRCHSRPASMYRSNYKHTGFGHYVEEVLPGGLEGMDGEGPQAQYVHRKSPQGSQRIYSGTVTIRWLLA